MSTCSIGCGRADGCEDSECVRAPDAVAPMPCAAAVARYLATPRTTTETISLRATSRCRAPTPRRYRYALPRDAAHRHRDDVPVCARQCGAVPAAIGCELRVQGRALGDIPAHRRGACLQAIH